MICFGRTSMFAGGCVLGLSASASAQNVEQGPDAPVAAAVPPPEPPVLNRPVLNPFELPPPARVTAALELTLGWLVLPFAQVCGDAGCASGDSSPLFEFWGVVRPHRHFAFGGGLALAPFPTTAAPTDTSSGVDRRHARSYLTLEAIGRYYPWERRDFDLWLGPGLGLVVMSDNFASAEGQTGDEYIGSPGVTVHTEALSMFGAAGISFDVTKHFLLGGSVRGGAWLLPDVAATSPFLDQAAITGPTFFFSMGLSAALRAEL